MPVPQQRDWECLNETYSCGRNWGTESIIAIIVLCFIFCLFVIYGRMLIRALWQHRARSYNQSKFAQVYVRIQVGLQLSRTCNLCAYGQC